MSISMRLPAAKLDDDAWKVVSSSVRRFEASLSGESPLSIDECLPSEAELRRRVLIELIKSDQENRWPNEEKPTESYLEDWPELAENESDVAELVSAECLTRAVLGGTLPTDAELRDRFGSIAESVHLDEIAMELSLIHI